MKKIILSLFCVSFLLGGCVHRIHESIDSTQLAAKSPLREQEANKLFTRASQACIEEQFSEALKLYQEICDHYAETDAAPQARHHMGRLFEQSGKHAQALEQFQFIGHNYTHYPHYNEVAKEVYNLGTRLMSGCERAKKKWLFFNDNELTLKCFRSVVEMAPFASYAPAALLCIAQLEAKGNVKHRRLAMDALDQIIENYPNDPLVPEAYLMKGDLYMSFVHSPQNDQGATQKAIRCYEKFLLFFEKTCNNPSLIQQAKEHLQHAKSVFAESRLVLGDFFLYRRHYELGAVPFYQEVQRTASATQAGEIARSRLDDIYTHKPVSTNWADKVFGIFTHTPPPTEPLP